MTREELDKLWGRLERIGRLAEIQGPDRRIVPSDSALRHVDENHGDKSDAEKWQLATAQTMIELAEKYQAELN